VSVVGSRTGTHAGRLLGYSQGDGASFVPARPFAEGERVTVHAQLHINGAVLPLTDEFAIADANPISSTPEALHGGNAADVQRFASRPDLRPPKVTVGLAPYSGAGQAGPMILEPDGGLVWFKPLPTHTEATNLQVQQYSGQPVLTWWEGHISVHGFGEGEEEIANRTYTVIAHVRAGNGLRADLHEFALTPQGTALITAYDPIRCNLTEAGGSADGAVTDSLFQEIDVRTGLVMYQWTALDHVRMLESYEHAVNSNLGSPFDFFHLNSISVDRDGSILISSRNTWTAYNLNPATGQINWQLGGRHSTYKLGSNVATAWQHDPRELENGTFSIFDNGASPTVHSQSRGVIIGVNQEDRTATLLGQLEHTPPLLATSQGNIQALPNGDWFIGWGALPNFSEFSPSGQLLFDASLPHGIESYRSFRFNWTGTPAHPPAFALQHTSGAGGVVYASWNGATQVASWRVLSGRTGRTLRAVAEAPRSGFETAVTVPAHTLGAVVAVQALDSAGAVIGTAPARATS
jgi:hypothetical protein